MKLLELIRKSIHSPHFYEELQNQPLSFSIKYFYSLTIGLSLALTLILSFTMIPAASSFLKDIGPAILRTFPNDLVIEVKNGKVRANVPEPYLMPLPDNLKTVLAESYKSIPQNILVIDTQTPFSPEKFYGYSTLVWLTKETVVFDEGEKGIRIQFLNESINATIDKSKVFSFFDAIRSISRWLAPILVFGIFVFSLVAYSTTLLYLFFGALLVWVISKIRKINLDYRKSYQVGIHAATLSVIVASVSFLFAFRIPFLFTAIMIIVALMNLVPEKKPQVQI